MASFYETDAVSSIAGLSSRRVAGDVVAALHITWSKHGWYGEARPELRRSAMSTSALLLLSRALHGVTSLEALMDHVRTVITENTRYNRAYIHLIHPDQTSFEIIGWPLPNDELVRTRLATIDVRRDKAIQRVFAAREPFVVDDLRLDPDADQAQVKFFGNRTAIVVPMFEGDRRIGPLVIPTYADQGVMPPTREEFEFFVQIGSLVGVVIGRLRAEESRARLEQELARTQRMEALGRMAGEVAHDFNNLLLTILANLELALGELGEHSAVNCLRDVEGAAQRAARLTKQLLASSRGQVLDKDVVSLPELLRNVVALVAPLLPECIALQMAKATDPIAVVGDSDQLERVVMNLILNARDAIKGKGRIAVDLQTVRVNDEYVVSRSEIRSGDYALLTVSDDGEGMSLQTQARMFEPFFTTKASDRGTGLGLAVVLGIVEQHCGDVHVYSEVGLGTSFKVYLPLAQASPPEPTPPPEIPRPRHRHETILVVDDDEHVRRTIERILLRHAYRVQTAASAHDALRLLGASKVDLLLTDLVLTESQGVALAEQAHALDPSLKVLFMTGYARGMLQDLSEPHLNKPFSAAELLALIRTTIG